MSIENISNAAPHQHHINPQKEIADNNQMNKLNQTANQASLDPGMANITPEVLNMVEQLAQQIEAYKNNGGAISPEDLQSMKEQLKALALQISPDGKEVADVITDLEKQAEQTKSEISDILNKSKMNAGDEAQKATEAKASPDGREAMNSKVADQHQASLQQATSKDAAMQKGEHLNTVLQRNVAQSKQVLETVDNAKQQMARTYASSPSVGNSGSGVSGYDVLSAFGSFASGDSEGVTGGLAGLIRGAKGNAVVLAMLVFLMASEFYAEAIQTQTSSMTSTLDDMHNINKAKGMIDDLAGKLPFSYDEKDPNDPTKTTKVTINNLYDLFSYAFAKNEDGSFVNNDPSASDLRSSLGSWTNNIPDLGNIGYVWPPSGDPSPDILKFTNDVVGFFSDIDASMARVSPSDELNIGDTDGLLIFGSDASRINGIDGHLQTGSTQAGSVSTQQNAILQTYQQDSNYALGAVSSALEVFKAQVQMFSR